MGNLHSTNQTPGNLFNRPNTEPVSISDLPTKVQHYQAKRNRPIFNKQVEKQCSDAFRYAFDKITEADGEAAKLLQFSDPESELNRGQRYLSNLLHAWQLGIIVPQEPEGSQRPRSLSSTSGKGSFPKVKTKARIDEKLKDHGRATRQRMLGDNATRNKVSKLAACKKPDEKGVAPAKKTRRVVIGIDLWG